MKGTFRIQRGTNLNTPDIIAYTLLHLYFVTLNKIQIGKLTKKIVSTFVLNCTKVFLGGGGGVVASWGLHVYLIIYEKIFYASTDAFNANIQYVPLGRVPVNWEFHLRNLNTVTWPNNIAEESVDLLGLKINQEIKCKISRDTLLVIFEDSLAKRRLFTRTY